MYAGDMRHLLAVVLSVGMLACSGRSAPTGPVTLREGRRTHALTFARAAISVDDMLIIELSDVPLTDTLPSPANSISVALQAGPGRTYFAGAEVPVPIGINVPGRSVSGNVVAQYRAGVALEPFRRARGAHVRGTLRFDGPVSGGEGPVDVAGAGAFDAVLTDIYAQIDGTAPTTVPTAPVAGHYEQTDFVTRSAVATYETAPDGSRYVDAVWLLGARAVTCDGLLVARAGEHFVATARALSVGGEGLPALTGRAMPIEPSFRSGGSYAQFAFGYAPPAWLRFDAIELRPGATVRGALFAADTPGLEHIPPNSAGHFAGTFSGIACERRPDPVGPPPPQPEPSPAEGTSLVPEAPSAPGAVPQS